MSNLRRMPSLPDPEAGERVVADHRRYVFTSWSAQESVHPLPIAAGEGVYVWDFDGKRYLDLASQLVNANLGHRHPAVVAAIRDQADQLCTVAPQYASAQRSQAARMIAELAPGDLNRVFFTTGGTESVEHAVRMARVHTGRPKILSAYRSYHGATALSIHLTGDARRWPNDRGNEGVTHFFGPFLYRSSFTSTDAGQESERALQHLHQVIEMEGPSTIAAVILETVPGNPGILPPPPDYLAGVRELCDRFGIVYIADEVMCGFGRTGAWFAVDHWDVVPDLLTFAKGVNSGYVPLGGVILSDRIAATFASRPYPGGLTYSGHPLACASAVAAMKAMDDEGIIHNALEIGKRSLGPGLQQLAEAHPSVGEVRGLGVFWAIELVKNRETREPMAPYGGSSEAMGALASGCLDAGVLPLIVHNRLHVVPPCIISHAEVAEALSALDRALDTVDGYCET